MMYSTPLGTAKPLINFPTIFPNQKTRKNFYLTLKPTKRLQFNSRPRVFLPKASSNSVPSVNSGAQDEDFVTRLLRENPSQVEPRRLIGNKLYTLKEKEDLSRGGFYEKVSELLKRLNLKALGRTDKEIDNESDFVKPEGEIYLKDLLREHKGKLYVPEKVFMPKLSEEEEFDKVVKELPIMKYEDFQEYLNHDKVKLVTFKEDSRLSLYRDFVVDLKEIPGEKSLHRTKWAMRLNNEQAQDLLEAYKGPLNEIENQIESQMMSRVGKVPEFPPPAASKLSSRMIIEFGVVAAAIASTSIITLASLASILLYAMTYSFEVVEKVIWPSAIEPVLKLSWGLIEGFFQKVGENLLEFASASAEGGGPLSQVSEFIYSLGGIFSGIGVLKPVMVITLMMVCAIRFTIARKPKNFKKWDIWQGIEFSQSKAQARVDGSTGVKFSDVAGIDDAVEELQELVRYLKNPKLFDQLGIKPPHGVLLEGPPGCGKTLVAKAIAGEAGVPFYQMAGSEFVEILVGVGSARVRDLFKRAKINKPSVIFIDEIDALGTRRQTKFPDKMDTKYNSAVQERETTLNQLLIELDGFDTGKGVIFLGATNRRDLLDPALLRPGRFDRKIRIRPPNAKGREDILKVHARKVKLSDTVDLATYANNLPGWTGAKLAQLLQEAALIAVRKGHTAILPSDMDNAVDRLTVGPRRVGMYLNHYGQCRRATAEMGAAFTSQLLRRFENAIVEPCARVSIHPHGETLSQLVFNRLKDESAYTYERKPQLLHRLQVFLGARAAEEVIFGRDTSKASVSYLASASWLARKIITIWNMENPMVLHAQPPPWRKWIKAIGPRIDFEGSLYKSSRIVEPPINFSLGDDIAIRTEALMQDMYKKTVDLLRHHNAALLKAVKVLIDQREISGDEIDFIIENYPPQTPASIVLEERNPGSLPFFEEKQEQSNEVEYTLLSS